MRALPLFITITITVMRFVVSLSQGLINDDIGKGKPVEDLGVEVLEMNPLSPCP
jgi:hypothetical protein